MPTRLQELKATLTYERHRFGSDDSLVLIAEAIHHDDEDKNEVITIKLRCSEDDQPKKKFTYLFYGLWDSYDNKRTGKKEKQFAASSFTQVQPHGRVGVVAYLAKAPGIGPITAERLFKEFGSEAVKILRTDPERATSTVPRLAVQAAREAAAYLEREKKLEDCTIELTGLLDGHGFPKTTIKKAIMRYGNVAAQMIRERPYLLMNFRGCGWKKADALYLELGHNPAAIKRQTLCAWHAAASLSSGDTWCFFQQVKLALNGSVGGASVNFEKAMRLAVRGQILSVVYTCEKDGPPEWDGQYMWVAEEKKANQERELGKIIAEMIAP